MKKTKVSKLMSYILRHNPGEYRLTLGEEGYIDLTEFINAINKKHPDVTWFEINGAVHNFKDKRRFEINGDKIRALHGHTVKSNIHYKPCQAPKTLLHGTTDKAWESIKNEGLKPMAREYVHLTDDPKMASDIGNRYKGNLVVLAVDTSKISGDIYNSENGIFLTKQVPKDALTKLTDAELKQLLK